MGFFLSSFFKLILQLESNTLYRESKHEIAGSGSYLLFSILYFFFSLNLDYIFHFSVNLFWMYTFLFYIGGSKVKCKRGIITTKCNCAYQKHKPFLSKKRKKKDLTILLHLHLFQWQLRQSVCGVQIRNKNGWWRIGSCNRYQSLDDVLMRGSVATWSCGNNNQQAGQHNDAFLCCLFTNNEQ